MEKIGIRIIYDQVIIREGLARVLERDDRFSVISSLESVTKCPQPELLAPDVAIIGHSRPERDLVGQTLIYRTNYPGAKILNILPWLDYTDICRLSACRSRGIITIRSSGSQLQEAVVSVMENKRFVCSEIKNFLWEHYLKN